MFEVLVFATLNGLVTGLLLFMLASGLTLIFSMMGVLNFAHASFYMLGAYFAYSISLYLGFWPGLLIAPLLVGLLGALIERYGLRRVHQHGHVAELVFTFGLAFLIDEAVQFFWGPDTKNYQSPDVLDFPLFTLFGQEFSAYRGFMIGISVLIFIGLYRLLTRSRVGIIIQAAITHPPYRGQSRSQRAANFYGGIRHRQRARRSCRRHRRACADHFSRHGNGPRQYRICNRRYRWPRLPGRRSDRVTPDWLITELRYRVKSWCCRSPEFVWPRIQQGPPPDRSMDTDPATNRADITLSTFDPGSHFQTHRAAG